MMGLSKSEFLAKEIRHYREQLATLTAERDRLLLDSERLSWLIKQGPPGAAQGIGLNEEAWDMACMEEPPTTDQICMRAAIDSARKQGDPNAQA